MSDFLHKSVEIIGEASGTSIGILSKLFLHLEKSTLELDSHTNQKNTCSYAKSKPSKLPRL